MSTTDQQQSSKSDKKKTFKQYARKPEEAKAGTIPMLKYGKGNNFYKFKTAVATQAMKEFGNLGKLINLEAYYVPVFDPPDLVSIAASFARMSAKFAMSFSYVCHVLRKIIFTHVAYYNAF